MKPIQSFSSGMLAEIIRRQPASKEKTRFAWQLAVGPALARVTTVELDAGVLRVALRRALGSRDVRAQEAILPTAAAAAGARPSSGSSIAGTSR